MKLSEIKGEKAFEVVADILEPISEIAMDAQFMAAFKAGKPKLMLVKYILKKQKSALIRILAALDLKTVDEYMETVNLVTLPQQILDMLNDPEVSKLFGLQSQTEKASSGSASENIEASEK